MYTFFFAHGAVLLLRVFYSENPECRQGFPGCRRSAVIWQVQITEAMHESVRPHTDVLLGRLQSVATQVLPTFQHHGLRQAPITSAVCSLP